MIKVNGKVLDSILFPNKEILVDSSFLTESKNYIVEYSYTDSSSVLELLFVLQHIRIDHFDARVRLIIQYMPYSRMDRSQEGSCFTLRYLILLISQCLTFNSEIFVLEPHSEVTTSLFSKHHPNTKSIDVAPWLVHKALYMHPDISVVCYPDKGALKRYSASIPMSPKIKKTHCEKIREFSTGEIKGYVKNRLNAAIGAYFGNTGAIGYAATYKVPGVNYTYGISSKSDVNIPYDDINHATLVYDVTDKNNITPNPTYLQPSIGVIRWHRTA